MAFFYDESKTIILTDRQHEKLNEIFYQNSKVKINVIDKNDKTYYECPLCQSLTKKLELSSDLGIEDIDHDFDCLYNLIKEFEDSF